MAPPTEFSQWLQAQLVTVDLDDDIFVDYINGILADDEFSAQEQQSIIQSYLEAVAPIDDTFVSTIVSKWADTRAAILAVEAKEAAEKCAASRVSQVLTDSVSTMQQMQPETVTKTLTEEDKDKRAALLQYYGYGSDDDDSDLSSDEGGKDKVDHTAPTIDAAFEVLNINRQGTGEELRERRSQQKAAHAQRVERDKTALDADRKSKAEKKEARRKAAQKGERRR